MSSPGKSVMTAGDRAKWAGAGANVKGPGGMTGECPESPESEPPHLGYGFTPRMRGVGGAPGGVAVYIVIPLIPGDDPHGMPGGEPMPGEDDSLGLPPGQGGGPPSPSTPDPLMPRSEGPGGLTTPRGAPFSQRSITH